VEELNNIDNIEFQRFLEENNQVVLNEKSVALADWVNDRKLVFQSDPLNYVFHLDF